MTSQRVIEVFVGLFVMAAIAALLVLALKVSGLTSFFNQEGYTVRAAFDDIGQLKIRSPVKIGGVTVGEVKEINLDPASYKAVVSMWIYSSMKDIPDDSTASILTAGLLGDNYIAVTPMYSTTFYKNGGEIQETHSAMILERLVGQLLYKVGHSEQSNSSATPSKTDTNAPSEKGVTQ